jgi:hypothetical protein
MVFVMLTLTVLKIVLTPSGRIGPEDFARRRVHRCGVDGERPDGMSAI